MLGEEIIRQPVGGEPTYLGDLVARSWFARVGRWMAEEGDDHLVLAWLRVDAHNALDGHGDTHLFHDLAQQALVNRFAVFQPAARQIPPTDVAPPRQQVLALLLDNREGGYPEA